MIRVLIADDHAVVRQGLRTYLELQEDIEVVGGGGRRAGGDRRRGADRAGRRSCSTSRCPTATGSARCRGCAEPRARVIVLTSFGEDDRLFAALRGGAVGLPAQGHRAGRARARDPYRARGPVAALPRRRRARHRPARAGGAAAGDRAAHAARARGAAADRATGSPTSGSRGSSGWRRRRSRRTSGTCWPSSSSPTGRRRRSTRSGGAGGLRRLVSGVEAAGAGSPRPSAARVGVRRRPPVLGPIADGNGARRAAACPACPPPSSPGPRGASASPSPTPWPTAAGGSSSTPATAPRSRPRSPRCATARRSSPSPATSATRGTAAASSPRRGPRIDLLVNNASALGPSPLPTLGMLPLDALEQVLRTNVVAPLGLVQTALPQLVEGARVDQRLLRRRRRALRGLGRLRRLQGRARPGLRDPRRGEPRAARLRRRPGRHAHAHAPGRLPRRGHLGPAAARGERPRAARADRGRPAERALRRAGARRGAGVSAALDFRLPPALEAAEPPEERGLARDEVRLMVARDGAPLVHGRMTELPRFLRPGDLLVVNESATIPAALEAVRADGDRVQLHLSTPDPRPGRRAELDRRAAPRRLPRRRRSRRRAAGAPRRRRRDAARRRRRRPALGRPRSTSAAGRCSTTSPSTARRSATPTSRRRGRSRPTRRLRPRARQRGDAERRAAVHAAAAARPRGPRRRRRPLTLHTGVSSLETRRAALPRALRGPGRDRRARQRDPPRRRPRDRRRHDRDPRAGVGGAPDGTVRAPRAGRRSSSRPSAASAPSTAWSRAGTSPRRATC